jgi:hypothetical protein
VRRYVVLRWRVLLATPTARPVSGGAMAPDPPHAATGCAAASLRHFGNLEAGVADNIRSEPVRGKTPRTCPGMKSESTP